MNKNFEKFNALDVIKKWLKLTNLDFFCIIFVNAAQKHFAFRSLNAKYKKF